MREFAFQLAGGPARVADKTAHGVVLGGGEPLRFLDRNMVSALDELRLWTPAEGGEDEMLAFNGASVKDGDAREAAERFIGEEIAHHLAGRAVENQADTAIPGAVVGQNEDSLEKVWIREARVGNEETARQAGRRGFRFAHTGRILRNLRVSRAGRIAKSFANDAGVSYGAAMGRRASSSVNPAWFAIVAIVVVGAIAGGWALKGTVTDPFRTLASFPAGDYLQNSNSLRGNVYKIDGVVGEQLGYTASARLISVEVNGEPVSIVVPAELRDVNVQKGQRFLFKVEVGDKGILKALSVKKA